MNALYAINIMIYIQMHYAVSDIVFQQEAHVSLVLMSSVIFP